MISFCTFCQPPKKSLTVTNLNPEILKQYAKQFPEIKLVTVNDFFGGWQKVQKTFFSDGAIFDAIYAEIN